MTEKPSDNDVAHESAATPPTVARTGAVAAVGSTEATGAVPKKAVWSWAFWDWATQPFNTVIVTFVFAALYLTSDAFIDPEIAALGPEDPRYGQAIDALAANYGIAGLIAGILIALIAPVLGQRADAAGNRKLWLGIGTGLLVACTLGLFFVEAMPAYFWFGALLIAAGSVFGEIAGVNYNAMLRQVSTPATIGRVSGLGWGFGYLGGILALILVVVAQTFDFFGLPLDNGLPFRVIALCCAIWTIIFAIPIFLNVPEAPAAAGAERVSFFRSYGILVRNIVDLFRNARQTFWFLLAAAVYRDGLAGVFTYGAILASVAFGFSAEQVILFGIAANLIAGVSTIFAGRLDDRFGARRVILYSLAGLSIAGILVFLLEPAGVIVFWIFGLLLTAFVGPVQAASRSLLARVTPPGREGEIFGLYATTGRAASFLSPAAWVGFIAIAVALDIPNATLWGVLGIVVILVIGFILMLFVKPEAPVAVAE
ncbi:MFS transporter [Microcella sp.]|uniref:MFS transporter n=1 Tax=Microcella sp. TaxID=1913979 RepID=UPI0025675F5D|nr:MFS transporter [Microcella sp.]MBX9472185.1 MFS transporter [Microcella sp.]